MDVQAAAFQAASTYLIEPKMEFGALLMGRSVAQFPEQRSAVGRPGQRSLACTPTCDGHG